MRDSDVGALPVGENDNFVSVVTDRDIVVRGIAEGKADANATVRDVLTEELTFCFEDDDIEDAANLKARREYRT